MGTTTGLFDHWSTQPASWLLVTVTVAGRKYRIDRDTQPTEFQERKKAEHSTVDEAREFLHLFYLKKLRVAGTTYLA